MKYLLYITITLLLLHVYLYWDKTSRINNLLSRIYSNENTLINFKKELKYYKENLNYEHKYLTHISSVKIKKSKFTFKSEIEKQNQLFQQTKKDLDHVASTVAELTDMLQIENLSPLDSPTRKLYENVLKFQKVLKVC